jgi:hypothetical protein
MKGAETCSVAKKNSRALLCSMVTHSIIGRVKSVHLELGSAVGLFIFV